jgi:hypothetical protein
MTLDLYGHLFGDRLDVVADAMDSARASALLSSSGTRLTDEFRYVLDMINIMFGVGWFRAAAILRRVTGSGSMLGR